MRFARSINVVGCHCAGEVCDVIVGGVLNPSGCSTMYEKLVHFRDKEDHIRQLLMQEPRGRPAMCVNLVLPPCNPKADAGFLIMETEEYPAMSGGNTIATTTVLLETGMVAMTEPVTKIVLETLAGLVPVTADCEGGKCKAVAFDNVPSFVFALDYKVDVPGLGTVSVDIAWGGMIYGIVDATSLGISISNQNGQKLIEYGERIKDALQKTPFVPVHPENPSIRGVSILEFTEPLQRDTMTAVNTVVVSPGRFDRCPCGTGSCARMAVLHARGQLAVGERFQHHSIIGSTFECHIRGTQKLGEYDAVLPTVKGSAWINSFKQMVLVPTDPWPVGFRVGDQWHMPE
ncbi:proline racemase [Aspergillus eucalypticola CBS 122712]|uniref:Proline racemase n=1 Tax=Aspergillus eucalypticola (strain CBS 122712 / IBT 29274) TaxID=1448314 RepID=A0A317VIV0_ASPEC|nr:proline racemase [Aspergillus eucalypticola CBS 122712]PWY72752.1 proline racemase [Aspergillus eucalypticola CBS 122712]